MPSNEWTALKNSFTRSRKIVSSDSCHNGTSEISFKSFRERTYFKIKIQKIYLSNLYFIIYIIYNSHAIVISYIFIDIKFYVCIN